MATLKDHVPVDNNLVIDVLQSDIIDKLHEAVKLMLAAGFEKECCRAYSSCRREYLSDCLAGLRRQQLNIGKTETTHEYRIRVWIKTYNVATRFLFPNERRLCERIFLGFTVAADLAFTDVCREFMIRQLNLANSFAVERTVFFKPSEVLLRIQVLFKTLHDSIPEYESLFSEPSSDSIRNEAINTWKRLGKATKDIFKELEDWICHDEAMTDFPGGLFPISCDVMDFVNGVCEAWNTLGLEKVFEEHPMVANIDGTSFSFSIQLTRIIELLDSHLEAKSKNCADPTLRFVFMMNNRRYIEQEAIECQSRMSIIFQDGMIRKLNAKVKENLEDYQRSSWDKVLGLLKEGGTEPEAVASMKENLKLFNKHFKEICRVQSTWYVLEEELRREIIRSIKKILWPAYRNFTGKLQDIVGWWHSYRHIKYSVDDFDALLNNLFRQSKREISGPKRRLRVKQKFLLWGL